MRSRASGLALPLLLSGCLVLCAGSVAAQVFEGVPLEMNASAVADEGPTVVGSASVSGSTGAAIWTPTGGIEVILPHQPNALVSPSFTEVSSDGNRLVVKSRNDFSDINAVYDLQTATWGPGAPPDGWIEALSDDGSTIAIQNLSGQGCCDSRVSGNGSSAEILEPYPGYFDVPGNTSDGMFVTDLSGDGSRAIGNTLLGDAFVWHESTGSELISIGDVDVDRISPNGDWIAGVRTTGGPNVELAVSYELGEFQTLDLGSAVLSTAKLLGITDDGTMITLNGDSEPQIWREGQGLKLLFSILEEEMDLDMTGWDLGTIRDVSASGRYIVGRGTNPDGAAQSWLVDLAGLPEPTTGLLLAAAGGAMLLRHRRGAGSALRARSEA